MNESGQPVIPAMNTLWFHFPQATRRALHGTPPDVERKFKVLDHFGFVEQGMEMFLMPSRLMDHAFSSDFAATYARLPFRCVHIGETDHDFLDRSGVNDDLGELAAVLEQLNCTQIVLHAHHLKENRRQRADSLRCALSGVDILIENNGFDNPWGADWRSVEAIFKDCPDFFFCLDVAHVKDMENGRLEDFLSPILRKRLREIHWSCSTRGMNEDPYIAKGYPGYGPYHALFPLTDVRPSEGTLAIVRDYPVVMEGVVPPEDTGLRFLFEERALLGSDI